MGTTSTTRSLTSATTRVATGAAFHSSVAAVDASMLPASWRPGCPVPPVGLRALTVSYWGFDDAVHDGRLIVNATAVSQMTAAFGRLFALRFPIERMQPIDAYGGDDDTSVAADNTAAFNCRPPDGGTGWSQHAYGLAVDVNPLRNPYVHADGSVTLAVSRPWVNRAQQAPGMIHAGDRVVQAFAAVGWSWGGNWTGARDYQHFSANGH